MYIHCLQAIGVASTQSSFALHCNTGAYDVPAVTVDKDLMVNVCIMVARVYVRTYVSML